MIDFYVFIVVAKSSIYYSIFHEQNSFLLKKSLRLSWCLSSLLPLLLLPEEASVSVEALESEGASQRK